MSGRPATITQADVARESVVYFVAIGNHVKIGVSNNLPKRLKAFMTSTVSAELLLAIPGDRSLEKLLHELLSEANASRELFHRDWRVQGFIDIVEYAGVERAMEWLRETTPARRKQKQVDNRNERAAAARQSKADLDAYFAELVAARKKERGW